MADDPRLELKRHTVSSRSTNARSTGSEFSTYAIRVSQAQENWPTQDSDVASTCRVFRSDVGRKYLAKPSLSTFPHCRRCTQLRPSGSDVSHLLKRKWLPAVEQPKLVGQREVNDCGNRHPETGRYGVNRSAVISPRGVKLRSCEVTENTLRPELDQIAYVLGLSRSESGTPRSFIIRSPSSVSDHC
jgi:hypothetical protein